MSGSAHTRVLPAAPTTPPADLAATVAEATRLLAAGGVIAVPTDTVYGLAVRGDLPASVERLYQLKERPPEKSMTIHLGDAEAGTLARYTPGLPPIARRLADRHWPGALTLVVPGLGRPDALVGLRVPDHALLRSILVQVAAPVLIPSANRSGHPPSISAAEVADCFPHGLDAILDDGATIESKEVARERRRLASTVVLALDDGWEILRPGLLEHDRLAVAACFRLIFVCTGNTCRSPMAAAYARHRFAEITGRDDIVHAGLWVSSAGLLALPAAPASSGARATVAGHGLSLEDHEATQAEAELLGRADLVLAMTAAHVAAIRRGAPTAQVELLDPSGRDVADPVGGDERDYAQAFAEIRAAIDARLPDLIARSGWRRRT